MSRLRGISNLRSVPEEVRTRKTRELESTRGETHLRIDSFRFDLSFAHLCGCRLNSNSVLVGATVGIIHLFDIALTRVKYRKFPSRRGVGVSTPDDIRQYRRLSGALRLVGQEYARELPHGTASLHLHSHGGCTRLDAYNQTGQIIAQFRMGQLSPPFCWALEQIVKERWPDPEGVVSPL